MKFEQLGKRMIMVIATKTNDPRYIEESERILAHGENYLKPEKVSEWLDWLEAGVKSDGTPMDVPLFMLFMLQRRQGDVYIIPRLKEGFADPITDAELAKSYSRTARPVALGEATGHHHVVTQERERLDLDKLSDETSVLYVNEAGEMVLRAKANTAVEHILDATGEKADHGSVELVPGYDYAVRIQEQNDGTSWVTAND